MKNFDGITLAGNILVDYVKMIGEFPKKGMLVTIEDQSLAVGGCVPNTAIDLKKLDKDLKVSAIGMVGKDFLGEFVTDFMKKEGVDVSAVKVHPTAPTSYSDVMTLTTTKERTFLHNRGANKYFSLADVDVSSLDCKMFHAGYLMLLDSFDQLDENGQTPMASLLKAVRDRGIETSIDIVSESSGNFVKVAQSALPYCDYVIINEIEAGSIAKINPRDENGKILDDNLYDIMQKIMEKGVNKKVIVHCPEKGFCLDKSGVFTMVESIKLPDGFIKGSVGAGDAFCAGSLYALYNGYSDEELLAFSNLVAINCLSEKDSVSGVKAKENLKDCLK